MITTLDIKRDTRPKIVCAAMKLTDGLIIASPRHWDETAHHIVQNLHAGKIVMTSAPEQGFIDQYGDFYTREDAYKIAVEMNQYRPWGNHCPGVLYSEDLY